MSAPEADGRPGRHMPYLPLTWPAAVFALLVGVTMAYVPYEFQATLYRGLSPNIRLLGTGFLASSVVLLFTALHHRAPRALDVLGRLLFCGVLGVYWWHANVLGKALTGAVLYPLMMAGVLAEARPA